MGDGEVVNAMGQWIVDVISFQTIYGSYAGNFDSENFSGKDPLLPLFNLL